MEMTTAATATEADSIIDSGITVIVPAAALGSHGRIPDMTIVMTTGMKPDTTAGRIDRTGTTVRIDRIVSPDLELASGKISIETDIRAIIDDVRLTDSPEVPLLRLKLPVRSQDGSIPIGKPVSYEVRVTAIWLIPVMHSSRLTLCASLDYGGEI